MIIETNWISIGAFVVAEIALTLAILRTRIAFVEHKWKKEKHERKKVL